MPLVQLIVDLALDDILKPVPGGPVVEVPNLPPLKDISEGTASSSVTGGSLAGGGSLNGTSPVGGSPQSSQRTGAGLQMTSSGRLASERLLGDGSYTGRPVLGPWTFQTGPEHNVGATNADPAAVTEGVGQGSHVSTGDAAQPPQQRQPEAVPPAKSSPGRTQQGASSEIEVC